MTAELLGVPCPLCGAPLSVRSHRLHQLGRAAPITSWAETPCCRNGHGYDWAVAASLAELITTTCRGPGGPEMRAGWHRPPHIAE